ncbi:cytochrome P450 [Streptosporangium sp. NPDC006013]|uniref:cytochrome P450 n=1 Tax=Streptosporangium sp. NPDC006013 TaxID=3155596 RepID=UPI0033BDDF14
MKITMADIYRQEYIDDPYPLYRRVREADPVYWDDKMGDDGAWMVTGYAAAQTALMEPRLSARRPHWGPDRLPDDPELASAQRAIDQQIVVSDAPEHTRLRQHLTRPFLRSRVDEMREDVARLTHHLLKAAVTGESGELDAMDRFAFALPAVSLAGVLGIPAFDERYLSWMLSLGLLIDDGPRSRTHHDKLLGGVAEYLRFFAGHVAERPGRGGQDRRRDLLQTLADCYTDGEFANAEELNGNLAFLLTAGQISTAHQIGNTLLHLLRDPEVYDRLRADPGAVPAATAEFMRYDASIQLTKRRVREPFELGGHEMGTGEEVYVWIGAAHRDPARFTDPDRLDLDRQGVRHIAFGHGVHYCLGARLGQLVHDVAVQAFIERVPAPRLQTDKIERSVMPTFRGPYKLPVGFGR